MANVEIELELEFIHTDSDIRLRNLRSCIKAQIRHRYVTLHCVSSIPQDPRKENGGHIWSKLESRRLHSG